MRLLFSQGILLRFILCPEVSSMRRCYVNKLVQHVPPPPFYPRQTSGTQSAAYLLQRAVTLRHRAKPARSLYRDPAACQPVPTVTHSPESCCILFMNEFGFEYGFGFFTVPDTVFITLIFGPVNFAHSRVNSCQHAGCAVLRHALAPSSLAWRRQSLVTPRQVPVLAQCQYQCARR